MAKQDQGLIPIPIPTPIPTMIWLIGNHCLKDRAFSDTLYPIKIRPKVGSGHGHYPPHGRGENATATSAGGSPDPGSGL